MLRTRDSVLQTLAENGAKIRGFGVRRLGLSGSWARGDAAPASDLDLVVEFERKSFDAYMDLKTFLEDLLGRPVDLVPTNAVKPHLRAPILESVVDVPGL